MLFSFVFFNRMRLSILVRARDSPCVTAGLACFAEEKTTATATPRSCWAKKLLHLVAMVIKIKLPAQLFEQISIFRRSPTQSNGGGGGSKILITTFPWGFADRVHESTRWLFVHGFESKSPLCLWVSRDQHPHLFSGVENFPESRHCR